MKDLVSKGAMRTLIFLKENKEARYSELLKALGLSSVGLTNVLENLVSRGLVLREIKPNRSVYYRLNESRMDEINKLINAYLEHEKKELKEKLEFAIHYIVLTDEERKKIGEVLEILNRKLNLFI